MPRNFQRLGGGFQLVVDSSSDLDAILDLDESQWAATSAPVDALNSDPEFLAALDDDANARIRTDEVRRAISWLLSMLRDRSGIDARSTVLKLSSIDVSKTEGQALLSAAKQALQNLGLGGNGEITLEQMRSRQHIISNGLSNGDGVIPPEAVSDPELVSFIKDIMATVGKCSDLGGKEGVDKALLDSFSKDAAVYLKWLAETELPLDAKPTTLMPFGLATHEIWKSVEALRDKLDEFFDCCKALAMPSSPSRFGKSPDNPTDILDADAMKSFLATAPLAQPDPSCVLPLSSGVNPLWQAKLDAFARDILPKSSQELTLSSWEELKLRLAPYGDWLKRKVPTKLDSLTFAKLSAYRDAGLQARLLKLIDDDLAVAKELEACGKVKRLILYQAKMLEFVNNFVSFTCLFNPERTSMIQAGRLVMDGRHFTLATRITDIEEHKKIALRSDICIMYLVLSTGPKDALKTMKIAVGVTSGFMWNLYPGKNGVFFTPDGAVWDAKVVDLLSQPVSFSEALRMPFYKLGEFMGRQADRFLSTKGKEIEDKAGQLPLANSATAALQPSKQQSAMSGSMLLMGGGVGIAALGTSFAFMAQSLSNISLGGLLTLACGVMLIFGGPILAVSIYKLRKRNIAMFLEAGGWALNEPLRMTRKMGLIFTHRPALPLEARLLRKDLVNPFFKTLRLSKGRSALRSFFRLLLTALVVALLLLALWLWLSGELGCYLRMVYVG